MELQFGYQSTKVNQLADMLSQAISAGEFKVGGALPSINTLSRTYNVCRDTVFKAFLDLRERGLIDSVPGKGYYVTNSLTNVLLLLDQYSAFKDALYSSFTKNLPSNYIVDLLFHQYNERLFNTLIRESLGRYNKYVVMNFDNEKLSSALNVVDKNKLCLLDFGKFDKEGYSYVCQDFDQSFYDALVKLQERFQKYKRMFFVFPKKNKHPRSSQEYFTKFCADYRYPSQIIESMDGVEIQKGDVFLAIEQKVIVQIIKMARAQGVECGRDFGLVAYNDFPSYDVMGNGITAISIDFSMLGSKAAEFVCTGTPLHEFMPTEIIRRGSL